MGHVKSAVGFFLSSKYSIHVVNIDFFPSTECVTLRDVLLYVSVLAVI